MYSCKNSWYIEENCAIIVFGLLQKTISQLYEFFTDSQKSAKLGRFFCMYVIDQGSPTPRPPTGPWPVRNQATQQELNGPSPRDASVIFTAARRCLHYHLGSTFYQVSGGLRFS